MSENFYFFQRAVFPTRIGTRPIRYADRRLASCVLMNLGTTKVTSEATLSKVTVFSLLEIRGTGHIKLLLRRNRAKEKSLKKKEKEKEKETKGRSK